MESREVIFKGTRIVLKDDHSMCMHAGFCGNAITNVWKMTQNSDDSRIRGHLMAMVE